ncbi:glycoside hydrolase family 30 protein [Alicyclobacillus fodiniaquatilis]|uniref:Glycoside hydrolase n=1 Tax=Alicyclobacillus fodiniaquatilis TaxID=1661150 RepID=A0ABW4JHL3_9BACL
MPRRVKSAQMTMAVLLATGLLSGCSATKPKSQPTAQPHAGTVVDVDPAVRYQTWQGWGTSLAWFAYVLGGAPDKIRNHIADLLFDPTKGLGLNVVRYNIGGGENPQYNFMDPRARVPGYEPSPGKFDWQADKTQRWMLQAAKDRGANVFEAFSNSPPYWMTNSGSVTGAKDGGDNLKASDYQAFAEYLATVVKHFQTAWHIDFSTVEPFNEPVSNWWKFGGTQEGAHFDNASQSKLIPMLTTALQQQGLHTGIAAPDDNSVDETLASWNAYPSAVQHDVTQINTHGYNGSDRQGLNAAAAKAGKNLWMSEYGDGDSSGMTMSTEIIADVKQLKPTAWVYWQAVDGPGWGMLQMDVNHPGHDQFKTTEKYYVMENYSKFIRPNYQFIQIGLPNALAAYNRAQHTLVIVTTNASSVQNTYDYNLKQFSKLGASVKVYRTSKDEHLKQLAAIPITQSSFSAVAKSKSVTTYVLTGVEAK